MEALVTGQNALLESPTGTGKTLALLCSCSSWLKEARSKWYNENQKKIQEYDMKQCFDMDNLSKSTKKQESQSFILKLLPQDQEINYAATMKLIKMNTLEQFKSDSEIDQLMNKIQEIEELEQGASSCSYYEKAKDKNTYKVFENLTISELANKGQDIKFCPFFSQKVFIHEADIILIPYNYLVMPQILGSKGIELENSIIIIDEGHNIGKSVEEMSSFEFTLDLLQRCSDELQNFKGYIPLFLENTYFEVQSQIQEIQYKIFNLESDQLELLRSRNKKQGQEGFIQIDLDKLAEFLGMNSTQNNNDSRHSSCFKQMIFQGQNEQTRVILKFEEQQQKVFEIIKYIMSCKRAKLDDIYNYQTEKENKK
ncbi:regulator of telomere elongation helicase 1 homolog [Stylonychia lemnae]|uniref:Regulator of telomere elongation helicase 1 homolog n=1 Tax=Stylonychia lemnae TaxID=5949 RepID=A0A078AP04_STYLE|nr:regulator of telomere elongation helicase 1 homolog [Stylonychia lemnae]|eukprot:CDW83661.1 regulator of telomere elongation helicase 1 homolog [Stylonychia lemnae]